MRDLPWRTLIALGVVYLAVLLGWNWIWGVLFIMWTIPAIYSGRAHLVEEVSRDEHPVIYWALIVTWIGLSIFLIITDLLRLIGG